MQYWHSSLLHVFSHGRRHALWRLVLSMQVAPVLMCVCSNLDDQDDLLFGVHEEMLYARNSPPVHGAQWTGIVTQIAIDMLESGAVEAVVCVQSADGDRFTPKPVRVSFCLEI